VSVDEDAGDAHRIEPAATATALFAGWTARGPVDQNVRVSSFADFERAFGGLDPRSLLGYCVQHFFQNGGKVALVARIAQADKATRAGAEGKVLAPTDRAFRTALLRRLDPDAAAGAGRIDAFNLLCVPGLVHAGTIARLQHACRQRRAFMIIDSAPGTTAAAMAASGTRGLRGVDGAFSALYFPWLRAADPMQGGALRDFPPCGFIAGLIARTDLGRGVWKAPAGTEARLTGAHGLSLPVLEAEADVLNPRGINCLRMLPGGVVAVWGARTLLSEGDPDLRLKYVPVQRTALFIEESLYQGTQWVVFEPNGEALWTKIRATVDAFMAGLFRQGAFMGSTLREACFVKCDRGTMTQNDIDNGVVNIEVGYAPLKPAEFVVIRIRHVAGAAG
jgi:phage tail sheath protein FI